MLRWVPWVWRSCQLLLLAIRISVLSTCLYSLWQCLAFSEIGFLRIHFKGQLCVIFPKLFLFFEIFLCRLLMPFVCYLVGCDSPCLLSDDGCVWSNTRAAKLVIVILPCYWTASNFCNKTRHKCSGCTLFWFQMVSVHAVHFIQPLVELHWTVFQNPEIWKHVEILGLVPCAPLERYSKGSLDDVKWHCLWAGSCGSPWALLHPPSFSWVLRALDKWKAYSRAHALLLHYENVETLPEPRLGDNRVSCLNSFCPYWARGTCQSWVFSLSTSLFTVLTPTDAAPRLKEP